MNSGVEHTSQPLSRPPSGRGSGLRELLAEHVLSDFLGRDVEDAYLYGPFRTETLLRWKQSVTSRRSEESELTVADHKMEEPMDRRTAIKTMAASLAVGLGLFQTACNPLADPLEREKASLRWDEYFQRNFRIMSEREKEETVRRLERQYELDTGRRVDISCQGARPGVLFGYAFNISKCRGYLECIRGCIRENNQDRASGMQYITIHEHRKGEFDFSKAPDDFYHVVPADGHFYIGTQCFHCEHPPCVDVCPVQATWKEEDGIVVVDYNWCIGCRYCEAACPYDARRFNWSDPQVPQNEFNARQHYLGNRMRKKGVMEKCTFCIQRTREGRNPACVEACPTGARIFGNLLDPNSEIRWVLEHKKVFRLKEDLGTEPKFWYFMD
jgi:molybdopterin-containing oxidoreductase family iron-sulfur binding subunit